MSAGKNRIVLVDGTHISMPDTPVYQKEDSNLPNKIMVRFIQSVIRIRGQRKTVWFVTSLLDTDKYMAKDVIALYNCRWRIETLFREAKVNLSADVLRSKLVDNVYKEMSARFIAINIIRMIAIEAADFKKIENPNRISFVHAIWVILTYSIAFVFNPKAKAALIYKSMLIEIASNIVPQRPDRNEPRAVRRERKHYPSLKITRTQWQKENVA